MRKILLLAQREYNTAVRTKAFLVMVLLAPVMMGGGLVAISIAESHVDTTDKHIAVVDHSGALASALVEMAEERNLRDIHDAESGAKIAPAYFIEVVEPADGRLEQRVALSDRVRKHELHAFVEIGADILGPSGPDGTPSDNRVGYHAENASLDDVRKWIRWPINMGVRRLRAAEAGVDAATVERLFETVPIQGLGLAELDAAGETHDAQQASEGRAIGVPAAMMTLMFMMIMVGAAPLVNVVLEEKMQRIAEVLLGSVRPFELMVGKLLGTLGVSFTVIAIYMGGGIAVVYQLGLSEYIPFDVLPWFVLYMIAAVCFFGSLLIAVGAACNDLKEAQTLIMPVWLLVMVPMFVWLPVAMKPLGAFATAMSLVPPFTPMLMLVRQSSPVAIPAWQPWAGLAGVATFTVLCVWVAGRIFRMGLLMQGKPPKLGELLKWALRG